MDFDTIVINDYLNLKSYLRNDSYCISKFYSGLDENNVSGAVEKMKRELREMFGNGSVKTML